MHETTEMLECRTQKSIGLQLERMFNGTQEFNVCCGLSLEIFFIITSKVDALCPPNV